MKNSKPTLTVEFYREANGNEPVRDWLQDLPKAQKKGQKSMSSKKRKSENIHAGSNFDDFLKEEGIFEHCQEVGAKYAFVMQLQDELEKQNLTKEAFAKRIGTSRSALDRLLDPSKPSNIRSLMNAATGLGKHLRISMT